MGRFAMSLGGKFPVYILHVEGLWTSIITMACPGYFSSCLLLTWRSIRKGLPGGLASGAVLPGEQDTTGHLSAWKLYSASALFSPVPQTLPLFTFLARPLPDHSVRCFLDFCFQGPLVANIRYPLRVRWPMLSRDLTRIIPPAFWKMACKTFETLSPSHVVKIDSMCYCCLILPDPNWFF